jgi:hypothetical protein
VVVGVEITAAVAAVLVVLELLLGFLLLLE